jgi:hypothetical protein
MSRRRFDRRGEAVSAGELVDSLLGNSQHGPEARKHRVITEWRTLVGDRIAKRTSPDRFDEGLLWVRVANSAWMHQLSFIKDDLLERINTGLGGPALVTDIRFHLGKQPKADREMLRNAERLQRRPQPRRRPLPPPAAGADLERIEREAATIEDPELRAVIIEARRRLNR